MSRFNSRPSPTDRFATEQTGGAVCGQITVVEQAENPDPPEKDPPTGDPPTLPGIGPLTTDNPRALAAGAVAGAVVLSRL